MNRHVADIEYPARYSGLLACQHTQELEAHGSDIPVRTDRVWRRRMNIESTLEDVPKFALVAQMPGAPDVGRSHDRPSDARRVGPESFLCSSLADAIGGMGGILTLGLERNARTEDELGRHENEPFHGRCLFECAPYIGSPEVIQCVVIRVCRRRVRSRR